MPVVIDGTTGLSGPATGLTGTAPSFTSGSATTAATVTGATQASITSAANLATVGTVTTGTWSGAFGAVSGANLTTLNASNLSSGTVATARLGTGTANTTTYLRGDSTWAAVGGGVTSLNGETGAITNTINFAIGSYITGRPQNYTAYTPNSTLAGTSLYQTPTQANYNTATWYTTGGAGAVYLVNTGTWRCMSQAGGDGTNGSAGLWVRIS